MTENEKERERKEKEEGYRFLTLRVKTELTYIYLHASQHHQKRKEKKASRFYPRYQPYLLTFSFSLTPPVFFFFFNLLWDRIMHVCIPYLVKSKCLPVSGSRKRIYSKILTDDVGWN